MARPTKLNEALAKRLCDLAAQGLSQEAAAASVGIDDSTLSRWLARGRAGRNSYAGFAGDYMRACAEHLATLEKMLMRHAITDWRCCAWILARRWPDRYSDPARFDRLELRFSRMSTEQLDAYIATTKDELGEDGA